MSVVPGAAMKLPWKVRSLLLIVTAALVLPLFSQPVPPPQLSARQLAQRVDAYYNRLHSLRADFTETYQGMGIHREERGTLILRKPGKMSWNYAEPAGKVFILDGKYGWFYTPGDGQAERLPASDMDDMRSPLRFLLGHTQLEKEFQNLSLTDGSAGLELAGVPKGLQEKISSIALGVTPEGVIRSITIAETDGARTAFTFTNDVPNAPTADSAFVFHAPAGIPVVDGLPPI